MANKRNGNIECADVYIYIHIYYLYSFIRWIKYTFLLESNHYIIVDYTFIYTYIFAFFDAALKVNLNNRNSVCTQGRHEQQRPMSCCNCNLFTK